MRDPGQMPTRPTLQHRPWFCPLDINWTAVIRELFSPPPPPMRCYTTKKNIDYILKIKVLKLTREVIDSRPNITLLFIIFWRRSVEWILNNRKRKHFNGCWLYCVNDQILIFNTFVLKNIIITRHDTVRTKNIKKINLVQKKVFRITITSIVHS